ncbi:MAG: phage minor head protein [Pseudomonadota bacterium]
MAEPLSAAFRLPFAQQIAAFRLRLGNLVGTARYDDLVKAEHDRAFMVAGAMKADLLADLAAAVERTIAEGGTLEAFRRDFRAIVERHGWHGWTGEGTRRGEAWRTRVIYRTNMATSYAAGRHAQLVEAGYGWWVYHHSGAEHPRLDHLSWDGLVLPAGHEFWKTHYPPNGWGCGCYVSGARSERGARRLGGNPDKPLPEGWNRRDPRTGEPPGIGKGWGYAPGASVAGEVATLAASKIGDLPAPIGSDFGSSIASLVDAGWQAWLIDILSRRRHEPGLVGVIDKKDLQQLAKRGLVPVSSTIMMKPGLIDGPKSRRHAAKGDALTESDLRGLSEALRDPAAVLIDNRTGKVLYLLRGQGGMPQIVVELDVQTRLHEAPVTVNMVVSAYRVQTGDIAGRIKGGALELMRGSI